MKKKIRRKKKKKKKEVEGGGMSIPSSELENPAALPRVASGCTHGFR